MLRGGISDIVAQIFSSLADGSDVIDFESFKDWYNTGGYSTIPWLELLDLNAQPLHLGRFPRNLGLAGRGHLLQSRYLVAQRLNLPLQTALHALRECQALRRTSFRELERRLCSSRSPRGFLEPLTGCRCFELATTQPLGLATCQREPEISTPFRPTPETSA